MGCVKDWIIAILKIVERPQIYLLAPIAAEILFLVLGVSFLREASQEKIVAESGKMICRGSPSNSLLKIEISIVFRFCN